MTDPVSGAVRGEQVIYSFNAGQLLRREMGVNGAPVVLASGITSLAHVFDDGRYVGVQALAC